MNKLNPAGLKSGVVALRRGLCALAGAATVGLLPLTAAHAQQPTSATAAATQARPVKLALIDTAVDAIAKEALAAARARTFSRKLLELRYADALVGKLAKDEILARYLVLPH